MSSDRIWKFRLKHILTAIEKIIRYTEDMDEAALTADEKTLDAVIRNFQIIGEAARKIPTEVRDRWQEVPWGQMMRMRHILVHEYDRINVGIVLRTATTHLPPLIELINRVLIEGEEPHETE